MSAPHIISKIKKDHVRRTETLAQKSKPAKKPPKGLAESQKAYQPCHITSNDADEDLWDNLPV